VGDFNLQVALANSKLDKSEYISLDLILFFIFFATIIKN
jgi:hypothetical protein